MRLTHVLLAIAVIGLALAPACRAADVEKVPVSALVAIDGSPQGGDVSILSLDGTVIAAAKTRKQESLKDILRKLERESRHGGPAGAETVSAANVDGFGLALKIASEQTFFYLHSSDPGILLPATVRNLSATANGNAITISWQLPEPHPTRVVLIKNGMRMTAVGGGVTSFNDDGRLEGGFHDARFGRITYSAFCLYERADQTVWRVSDVVSTAQLANPRYSPAPAPEPEH